MDHFFCGFARKRNEKDLIGGKPLGDEVCNAMNERVGFTAASASQNQCRFGWGCHHGELLWIELRILNEGRDRGEIKRDSYLSLLGDVIRCLNACVQPVWECLRRECVGGWFRRILHRQRRIERERDHGCRVGVMDRHEVPMCYRNWTECGFRELIDEGCWSG